LSWGVFTSIINGQNIFAGAGSLSPKLQNKLSALSGIGIYFSSNFGTQWSQINDGFPFDPEIRSIIISNSYILCGTYGLSVWRRPLSEIISIKNISSEIPSKYILYQNYPNPFNPTTKIKFDVPVDSRIRGNDRVVLKVYDILGKDIETLVNEKLNPGTYEVTFNASQYPSGVYFYRLTSDGYNETKRMILLK
jgi:hypothetical protein